MCRSDQLRDKPFEPIGISQQYKQGNKTSAEIEQTRTNMAEFPQTRLTPDRQSTVTKPYLPSVSSVSMTTAQQADKVTFSS